MANLITALSPNSTRVERLLGPLAQGQADKTRGWYGPAIPILGTPLRIGGDGEYIGVLEGGQFASLADYAWERFKQAEKRAILRGKSTLHGFSSLSDLISEATTGGKRQQLTYQKTGVAAAAAAAPAARPWSRAPWPRPMAGQRPPPQPQRRAFRPAFSP